MKTNKFNGLLLGALLLAAAALVSFSAPGAGSRALAAPRAAPLALLPPEAEMPALPEVTCVLDDTLIPNIRTCELWALPGSLSMPGGTSVPVWGFATSAAGPALVPGPVIRAVAGETLQVSLHNMITGQTIALGFPGQGGLVPDLAGVASDGTAAYTVAGLASGTFLYEAGLTPDGSRQVAMGLFGPLVVEPGPASDQEVILVFSEVDPDFNANPTTFNMLQYRPQYWLINGKAFPDTGWVNVAGGSSVLLRYLNAGVEHHSIGLLGLDQLVLAANGEALPFPRGAVAEQLPAGDTREVLLQVPITVNGTLFPLYNASLHQHNNSAQLADGSKRTAFGGMLAFLQVSSEMGGTGAGPVASAVAVTPSKTNGSIPVSLTATLTDDDTDVVAYEYSINVLVAPGVGTAIGPAPQVFVDQPIGTEILATLAAGQHTFYVRGKDAFGNWGAPGSAVLTLDKAGPEITGLGLNPNPTNGSLDLTLSGTADDRATGNSNVTAGEFSLAGGAWTAMSLSPLNSPVTGLSATIPAATVAALAEGIYPIEVRALDELGNWSLVNGSISLLLDKSGPTTTNVLLNPATIDLNQPLPANVALTATLAEPLSNGVQSTVATAEGFIDTVGAPGTGFAVYPTDGLFNGIAENVYYNIPAAQFASLAPGEHRVYVLGKDSAGNWGTGGFATINVVGIVPDTTGPLVSDVIATPNPTAGAASVLLTAVATDTQSNIAEVVWFVGTKPPRRPYAMAAADGAFDELVEDVRATIDVSKFRAGTYQISVRARDTAGNWSSIVTIILEVTK